MISLSLILTFLCNVIFIFVTTPTFKVIQYIFSEWIIPDITTLVCIWLIPTSYSNLLQVLYARPSSIHKKTSRTKKFLNVFWGDSARENTRLSVKWITIFLSDIKNLKQINNGICNYPVNVNLIKIFHMVDTEILRSMCMRL